MTRAWHEDLISLIRAHDNYKKEPESTVTRVRIKVFLPDLTKNKNDSFA